MAVSGNFVEVKCSRCQRIVRIETLGIKGVSYLDPPVVPAAPVLQGKPPVST